MSNLILPDDPNFDKLTVMGNAYEKTPKGAAEKWVKEAEEQRSQFQDTFKYASSTVAHAPDPWTKLGQAAGVSNMMTQPMWFSPLHTPQNWQTPSKRRETYQWSRHFYNSEPKVAAAIDFYSKFPMNGFKLECKSRKVLKFFEHKVVKKLKLNELCKMISSEYYMLGDVFVHTDIECKHCGGSAVTQDGQPCNHDGGLFSRAIILNPDWIEVQSSVLSDEPAIVMVPDEELQRIVFYKQPKAIYDKIPDPVKQLVLARKPIPLSNRTISHLKHMPIPYGSYGTSLIRRLFTTLAYKTKIMTANWIVAERLILPVRVVKVGSDDRPATSADIADIQQQLASTANDPNLTICTHHNFDYEWYGSCHDEKTEVLTSKGFKTLENMTLDDKVLCHDVYTNTTKYAKPSNLHVYDYDGDMVHFNSRRLDIMVTPNHKMLYQWNKEDSWKVNEAGKLKNNVRFLGVPHYQGEIKSKHIVAKNDEFYVRIDEDGDNVDLIKLTDFCTFIGHYLSDGTLLCKKSNYHVSVYQSSRKPTFEKVASSVNSLGFHVSESNHKSETDFKFDISRKNLVLFIEKEFSHGASNKFIPDWMKNLPKEYLELLLDGMIDGDGHKRPTKINSFVYTTVSEKLANDFQEVAFKCEYGTRLYKEDPHPSSFGNKPIYRIHISQGKNSNGTNPIVRKQHKTMVPYKGKVWCFTVPTGFFVTRRNGKITIQGNSGKILQVTQEMENIGKEILDGFMLNQSLLNGEMCHDTKTKVITKDGPLSINEFVLDEHEVLCFDINDNSLVYKKAEALHEYKVDKNLIHFKNNDIDILVTPNHRMLISRDGIKWNTCEAYELEPNTYVYALDDNLKPYITKIEKDHINEVPYNGTVWCLTVPTGFFATERSGKSTIQQNSGYQSAQVGVETLIRRLESWRHTLAEWMEERIFKPIAEMQGFIDEEESEELGEACFLYPNIKWNDLNLKDTSQEDQLFNQFHDKQIISTQTLLERMDIDYDQEVKRMRYEQTQMGPAGAAMPGMGGGGAGAGGMGAPLGGDMGGGMGADPMGGGMDPAGGMMGAPGGDMGGGGAPAMADASGKVMKKGKGAEQEQEPVQMQPIMLTSIEQKMAQMLEDVVGNLGLNLDTVRLQFPVENPKGGKPYALDFAMPHTKIAIETDGEAWHSTEDQKKSDQERDYLLAQRGWTVLRFSDKTIEDMPQAVKSTVSSYIQKALKNQKKKTASSDSGNTIYYAPFNDDLVKCSNYEKYLKLSGFKYSTNYIGTDDIYNPSGKNSLLSREQKVNK